MKQWLEMEIGITGGEEDGVVCAVHTSQLTFHAKNRYRITRTSTFVVFHKARENKTRKAYSYTE